MYILFRRHGQKRYFKRYEHLQELYAEIEKGHNDKFPGNNQFYYHTETKDIEILNSRLSVYNCAEYLEYANIIPLEVSVEEN